MRRAGSRSIAIARIIWIWVYCIALHTIRPDTITYNFTFGFFAVSR